MVLRGRRKAGEQMSWRDDKPTEKQLAYIIELHEFSEYPLPVFTGKTKGEACDYIGRYSKIAHTRVMSLHEDAGDRI